MHTNCHSLSCLLLPGSFNIFQCSFFGFNCQFSICSQLKHLMNCTGIIVLHVFPGRSRPGPPPLSSIAELLKTPDARLMYSLAILPTLMIRTIGVNIFNPPPFSASIINSAGCPLSTQLQYQKECGFVFLQNK